MGNVSMSVHKVHNIEVAESISMIEGVGPIINIFSLQIGSMVGLMGIFESLKVEPIMNRHQEYVFTVHLFPLFHPFLLPFPAYSNGLDIPLPFIY